MLDKNIIFDGFFMLVSVVLAAVLIAASFNENYLTRNYNFRRKESYQKTTKQTKPRREVSWRDLLNKRR